MAISRLDQFEGNILTKEEKEYRMECLEKTIKGDDLDIAIDKEFFPYLEQINAFPFIMTTQSCCGHNGSKKPYLGFRSALNEKDTIDLLLRPMIKFNIGISIELILDANKYCYCLRLNNEEWKKQIEFFVSLLETISRGLIK